MLATDHLLSTLAKLAALADRWIYLLGPPDAPLVLMKAFGAQTLEHELARTARALPTAESLVRLLDREPDLHPTLARLVPRVSAELWKGYGRAQRKIDGHVDGLAHARAHLRRLKAEVRATAPTGMIATVTSKADL